MTHEECAEVLTRNGIPLPPDGPIGDLRWVAWNGDWWAKTPTGWYWMRTQDTCSREWKHAPMGPHP